VAVLSDSFGRSTRCNGHREVMAQPSHLYILPSCWIAGIVAKITSLPLCLGEAINIPGRGNFYRDMFPSIESRRRKLWCRINALPKIGGERKRLELPKSTQTNIVPERPPALSHTFHWEQIRGEILYDSRRRDVDPQSSMSLPTKDLPFSLIRCGLKK
jgi:hypothetical protein